jgi:hydroxymethylpyrimidine/phosphomethylpyrimidine kinase
MSFAPPAVLCFAASDPTSGAGVQADLLTVAALGCHPLCAVTALTVQDSSGVERLVAMDAELVADQARRLLADIPVAAFKLGVLGSAASARAIASLLAEHPRVPVVLDPVLASARGDTLAGEDTIGVVRERLLPLTTVLTPNSLEARRLARSHTDLAGSARTLIAQGCKYVLITGTHEPTDDVVNTLYDARGEVRADRWKRLPHSYHGSGCTLASAIAAALAQRAAVPEAVRKAQEFAWQSLAAGFRPGKGQHVPNRFFSR